MSYSKSLFGYQQDEVAVYIERLKSTQGAEMLDLECRIENIQEEIGVLQQKVAPLRESEAMQRQKLEQIRQRIADIYSNSILGSYELDRRLNDEESDKLEHVRKKSQELDQVKKTMEQLCQEIEKLTQGFKQAMEVRAHE